MTGYKLCSFQSNKTRYPSNIGSDDIQAMLPACCWLWRRCWTGNSPAVDTRSRRRRTSAEPERCTPCDPHTSCLCVHNQHHVPLTFTIMFTLANTLCFSGHFSGGPWLAFLLLNLQISLSLSLSLHFNGHFPDEPGLAGVFWSKWWWRWWWQLDCWSYKSCKAPVKSSPLPNQHPVFLQAGCPSSCPTNSIKALKGKYHIPWTCLPQAQLGVFQLCLWPLIAPVTLGEGCHTSHHPSDATTPSQSTDQQYQSNEWAMNNC